MKDQLISKLNKIVKKYEIIDHFLPIQVPEWKSSNEYSDLLQYLKTIDELDIFDGKMQYIGASGHGTTINDICDWLIRRTNDSSPQEAYANLQNYLENEDFDAYAIMILTGLHIEENYSLSENIELIRPTSLANKNFQLSLFRNEQNVLPLPRIESILITPVKHKKVHVDPEDRNQRHFSTVGADTFEKLNDIRLLFSLLPNGRGPQSIGYSLIVDDSVPNLCGGFSWHLTSYRNPIMDASLIKIEANSIKKLYEDFINLEPSVQNHLRIILKNLNHHICSYDIIQKSIDLRICMESVFLNDGNKQELRFRLSLRTALLGETLEKRQEISKLFKKAYDITSTAIHTGSLSEKNIEKANKIFPEVLKTLKTAILLIMKNGKINWEASELMGTLNT